MENENKLYKRLIHMFNYETDDFFVNINLKQEISNKLFDYQHLHVFNLITALRSNNIILDGSDTGTGKTYCAIALCKQLNLKPFIICPKTVIPCWKQVCNLFKIKSLGIINYESIKLGQYFDKDNNRVKCPYIDIQNDENIGLNNIRWNLPRYSLLIFDEAHRCKNIKSQNGQLLLSAKNNKFQKIIMLSATISDRPEYFHIFGYMLGCYKNLKQANNWIKGMLLEDKTCIGNKPKLSAVNKFIYPNKGSRMQISELGNKFPSNQISANAYYIDETKRELVNKSFKLLNEYQDKLVSNLENNDNAAILKELMKARQLIEEIKIPIIEELTNDYLENGYSVAIFVNFNDTITKLSKTLNTQCIVNGKSSMKVRLNNVNRFQENEERLIICNMAISEGMSLHDQFGIPRISIISPSFSTTQLVQTLGRIHRAGAKTPAFQRIIFCANTCEEIICNRLRNNLEFLSKLNDNDLIKI